MATTKLGDLEVGTIVKIKENGVPVDFYVAKHNYESGLSTNPAGLTLLVRKECITRRAWDDGVWSTDRDYSYSDIADWVDKDYVYTLDWDLRSNLSRTTFKSGSKTLSRYAFLLSNTELGFGGNEGLFLPISNILAVATSNGLPTDQWTRSYLNKEAYYLTKTGTLESSDFTSYHGVRPALALPDTTTSGFTPPNAAPDAPAMITLPDSVRGGADVQISWSAATDPDGNFDGYIVERSYDGGSSWSQIYQGRERSTTTNVEFGQKTVMFRVCAYDTAGAKSGWRTSENKTVINNRAPAAPPSISVPLKPAGGEKLTVTWTASTDADGNLEGYELERQWDGAGAFTQIYKGAGLSYQDSIPKGEHTSVVYRVRAYDSFASYSSYTTSPSRTIDNNTAPVISCDLSGDLGEKSEGFSVPYTVSDSEQQEVTVIEKVGDLVKRTYKATLDEQNTFEVTGEYFQRILNGAQTVQIVATDSAGKSSTLELTFTKAVHKAVITLSEPLAVEEQITVAVLAITGKIPADATQLVELTNNGNDLEPVWEDATADVKAGRNYVFKNKSQTAGWAFNFRVTVERGESGEDGNIVSIQGGFQ